MHKYIFLLGFLVLALSASMAQNVPQNMSYQGYVTDLAGTPIADGNYNFTFGIYTSESGGVPLWTETHPTVAVSKGLFNVILGRGNPPNPILIQFDQQYFLGIRIGPDPEMSPRVRLTTSAYSFRSRVADGVRDGSITNASVDASAGIAASKLDPTVLTESDIVAGSGVTVNNVGGTLTISASPGAVTLAGDVTGPAGANTIANNAVTTPKILDNAVTPAKIAPDIVSSINNVTNDAGNINLVAGANVTITPDDGANTITIAAAGGGGGLTLPFNGTASTTGRAFDVENSSTGGAGYFWTSNNTTTADALTAYSNSTNTGATALRARAIGGRAIEAYNNSATQTAAWFYNSGAGPVAQFGNSSTSTGNIVEVNKTGGAGRGISVDYSGTGSAIYALSNTSGVGVEVDQDGTGNAAYFHIDNATSTQNTLRATTASTNVNSDALEVAAVTGNALDARNNSASAPTLNVYNASTDANAQGMYIRSNGTEGTIESRNYNASPNGKIFEGFAGTTSKFRMYNSGNFVAEGGGLFADRALLGENLGGTTTPSFGGYYADNAVIAWARMSGSSISEDFGVASVTSSTVSGFTTFTVTLNRTLSSANAMVPIVTCYEYPAATPSPDIAMVHSLTTNSFQVTMYSWNNTTKTWDSTTGTWYFMVLGRP